MTTDIDATPTIEEWLRYRVVPLSLLLLGLPPAIIAYHVRAAGLLDAFEVYSGPLGTALLAGMAVGLVTLVGATVVLDERPQQGGKQPQLTPSPPRDR